MEFYNLCVWKEMDVSQQQQKDGWTFDFYKIIGVLGNLIRDL